MQSSLVASLNATECQPEALSLINCEFVFFHLMLHALHSGSFVFKGALLGLCISHLMYLSLVRLWHPQQLRRSTM